MVKEKRSTANLRFLPRNLLIRLFNTLGTNPIKWSSTLKPFLGNIVWLALKILKSGNVSWIQVGLNQTMIKNKPSLVLLIFVIRDRKSSIHYFFTNFKS